MSERKGDLIYAPKATMAASILTKLSNAQQYYKEAPYTKFHPNRK